MENFRTQKEIELDIEALNIRAEARHAEISKKKEKLVLKHNEAVRKVIDAANNERTQIKGYILDINLKLLDDLCDAEKIGLKKSRMKHEFDLQNIIPERDEKIRSLKNKFDREFMALNDESRQITEWLNAQKAPLKKESHEAWIARQREKETIEA